MSEPALSRLQYESVTIDGQGAIVRREARTARGFVERVSATASIEFVEIPDGRFSMGSPGGQGLDDERPRRLVEVRRFFMTRGLVTQAQWRAVMGRHAACRFAGEELPVENVSWPDAQAFCERLSRPSGRAYRLPSEAQWEYACRAGTTTPFYSGETLTSDLANYSGEHTYCGEAPGLYRHTTTPAGMFPPNDFGLYDMHGNLWEWCADNWHAAYTGAPAGDAPWQAGGDRASRVVRGGSWHDVPGACRSAARMCYEAGQGDDFVGFRVVLQSA